MKKKNKKVKLSIEKTTKKITDKIIAGVQEIMKIQESKENKKKKNRMTPSLRINRSQKIKLYTLKSGKEVMMECDKAVILNKWFKCLFNRDYSKMAEYYQKLEPLVEGVAAEGGNLVPTVLYNALTPLLEDEAIVKPRATVIPMEGMKTNQLNISGIATKPIVQWSSEAAAKATSSMTFNQISLTPYTLAAIVPFSTQLRDDSPFNIVQILTKILAEAYVKAEEKAYAVGSGAGQPTGFSTYTPVKTLSAGGALTFDHINSAFWRMPQAYRNRAVWIMNSRTIEVLSMLKDSQNRPLLLENGILTQPGIPAMKGRPVLEQNDLGSATIYFIDLSAYFIGEKLPMKIDLADQATIGSTNLWQNNLIAIRIEGRTDGELSTSRALVTITSTGVS